MIKLSGSVGKMGPNKTGDVAVIQAALMNAKGGPYWPGPIDGKKTTKFVEAITAFQTAHKVNPANGTIQSFGPTMNRLKSALPMSMSGLGALPDTAVVFVASAGAREAEREAEETKRKAPFPKLEAEALAKIQKTIGKTAGLCLERAEDSVTKDGCFATELDFAGVKWLDPRSGKPMSPGREPQGVTSYVWSLIGTGTPWQKGSPSDLVFKSKRQVKSLKGLGAGPLSRDDKKLLGLTSPPRDPVLLACSKGCASLIRSEQIAKPAGAAEFQLLLQAISAPNQALARQITQAAGKAGGQAAGVNPSRADVILELRQLAATFGVPERALVALISAESDFRQFEKGGIPLISPSSTSTAAGLGQVTSKTASDYGENYARLQTDWKYNLFVSVKVFKAGYNHAWNRNISDLRIRATRAYGMYHDGFEPKTDRDLYRRQPRGLVGTQWEARYLTRY